MQRSFQARSAEEAKMTTDPSPYFPSIIHEVIRLFDFLRVVLVKTKNLQIIAFGTSRRTELRFETGICSFLPGQSFEHFNVKLSQG